MPKTTEERIIDLPYDPSARRASGGGSSSSGGGATAFLGLTDTPSTYSGAAGKVTKVNSGETAIEFGAVATATPTASAIVIADSDGKIGAGWLDDADISKTFLELTDTPSAYTGESLKLVRVNVGETALEFVASSGSGYTQEEIEDFTAAQFTGNTGVIDATYDDGTGAITLTLDVSAADRILYSTGADAWAETALTAFARTLLDDADAATARTTLGVVAGGAGDIWVEKAGDSMTGNLAIESVAVTGNSLAVLRDLAAANTNAPMVAFVQDNASDDQAALIVQQDGSGDILSLYDGATEVFDVKDGGRTAITQIGTTGNALAVLRDLAAASTDAPVVSLIEDHASDDQVLLYLQQDGTGAILDAFDGATRVLRLNDGGRLDVAQIIRALTSSGMRLEDDGGNLAIFIEDGGFVGIGQSNPSYPFDILVPSAASTREAILRGQVSDGNGDGFYIANNTSGDNRFVSEMLGHRASDATGLCMVVAGSVLDTYDSGTNPILRLQAKKTNGDPLTGSLSAVATRPIFDIANFTTVVMGMTAGGNLGIGSTVGTTAQGLVHAHDATGGMLFVTKTGIAGTPVVVVANGTGDVLYVMYFMAVIRTSGGAVFGTSNVIANNSSLNIYSSGSDTLRLRVNSDGSVDLTRTGGTLTYSVSLFMIWL